MDNKGKQPTTWQDYEQGMRSGSFSSLGSHVQWDDSHLESGRETHDGGSPVRNEHNGHGLRHRR
jgi:solute carrier family 32 (vesicular inhibitory amino acid transporter)